MPLPTPNDGEKESDFMNRCMGSEAAKEFEDQKQRVAVCESQFRKGKDGTKANAKPKAHPMAIEAQCEFFADVEG